MVPKNKLTEFLHSQILCSELLFIADVSIQWLGMIIRVWALLKKKTKKKPARTNTLDDNNNNKKFKKTVLEESYHVRPKYKRVHERLCIERVVSRH